MRRSRCRYHKRLREQRAQLSLTHLAGRFNGFPTGSFPQANGPSLRRKRAHRHLPTPCPHPSADHASLQSRDHCFSGSRRRLSGREAQRLQRLRLAGSWRPWGVWRGSTQGEMASKSPPSSAMGRQLAQDEEQGPFDDAGLYVGPSGCPCATQATVKPSRRVGGLSPSS